MKARRTYNARLKAEAGKIEEDVNVSTTRS